jgi:hypothetical protein
MRKNIVEPMSSQVTIWRMRIACWITKVTDLHSEYVTLLLHSNSGYSNALRCYVYAFVSCLLFFLLLTTNQLFRMYQLQFICQSVTLDWQSQ